MPQSAGFGVIGKPSRIAASSSGGMGVVYKAEDT
jgi:hypothetical protein